MEWKYFEHKFPGAELLSSDEELECYYDFVPAFVKEIGYLPIECRECYKALIFWTYSRVNENNFNEMLQSLPVSIHGKYDESVVVFYFKAKEKMLAFLEVLKESMNQFSVDGRIEWRVSGKYWQDAFPQFFKSAKELYPISTSTKAEITMKEWLNKKGLLC